MATAQAVGDAAAQQVAEVAADLADFNDREIAIAATAWQDDESAGVAGAANTVDDAATAEPEDSPFRLRSVVEARQRIGSERIEPNQLSFVALGSLPVDTNFKTPGGKIVTFKGFTKACEKEVIFASSNLTSDARDTTTQQFFVSPWDAALEMVPGSSGVDVRTFNHDDLLLRVLHRVVSTTRIRDRFVSELMYHLHASVPGGTAVALVGGAVRDAVVRIVDFTSVHRMITLDQISVDEIDVTSINDIDLAVAIPYERLEFLIADFFAKGGVPLTDSSFVRRGKHAAFGMLKIECKTGENDGVDIGVFKAGRREAFRGILPSTSTTRSTASEFSAMASDDTYYYGFSYETDAKTRDYSINAIYADLFSWRVIDPRGGMDCLKGVPRSPAEYFHGRHELDFIDPKKDEFEFTMDLGGRVRLNKFLIKKDIRKDLNQYPLSLQKHEYYVYALPRQTFDIYHKLAEEARTHVHNLEQSAATGTATGIDDVEKWMLKVITKLVKKTDDSQLALRNICETLKDRLRKNDKPGDVPPLEFDPAEARRAASDWLIQTSRLADCVLQRKLFRSCTMDSPQHVHLLNVCEAFVTEIPKHFPDMGDAAAVAVLADTSQSIVDRRLAAALRLASDAAAAAAAAATDDDDDDDLAGCLKRPREAADEEDIMSDGAAGSYAGNSGTRPSKRAKPSSGGLALKGTSGNVDADGIDVPPGETIFDDCCFLEKDEGVEKNAARTTLDMLTDPFWSSRHQRLSEIGFKAMEFVHGNELERGVSHRSFDEIIWHLVFDCFPRDAERNHPDFNRWLLDCFTPQAAQTVNQLAKDLKHFSICQVIRRYACEAVPVHMAAVLPRFFPVMPPLGELLRADVPVYGKERLVHLAVTSTEEQLRLLVAELANALDTRTDMLYFHGTNWRSAEDICINGISRTKSSPGGLDFSFGDYKGFYVTGSFDKAWEYARVGRAQQALVVYKTESLEELSDLVCRLEYPEQWQKFVRANRCQRANVLHFRHDVFEGPIWCNTDADCTNFRVLEGLDSQVCVTSDAVARELDLRLVAVLLRDVAGVLIMSL